MHFRQNVRNKLGGGGYNRPMGILGPLLIRTFICKTKFRNKKVKECIHVTKKNYVVLHEMFCTFSERNLERYYVFEPI